MFMFKHILLPLDGSEESESISKWVSGLARALGARVTLLAVVDPVDRSLLDRVSRRGKGTPPPAPETEDQGLEQAVEGAKRYLAAQERQIGADVETLVVTGSPAEEIVKQAGEVGADLIAMATHRESALARGVLGSVTDRVLHSSHLPVMAVQPKRGRSRSDDTVPAAIIVPLDGSELSEAAVPVGTELAKGCDAELVFMRAVHFPHFGMTAPGGVYAGDDAVEGRKAAAVDYLAGFVEQAKQAGVKARAETFVGMPAARIIEETNAIPNALVVMSTNGAGGLKRFVLGSVTDKVVRSSGNPVIVLPPGD